MDLASHPLLAPFWGTSGTRASKSDSLTLNDFSYTLRLDETEAELKEEEFSYYDSGLVRTRVVKGPWTALRADAEKVVLRIEDRVLVLLPDDIFAGDVEWGLKHHG